MKVRIKKLRSNAIIPTINKVNSYDIYACMDTPFRTIDPGKTEEISTGLQIFIPDGYVGFLLSRNGMATRRGLRMSSGSMLVESDEPEYGITPHDSITVILRPFHCASF